MSGTGASDGNRKSATADSRRRDHRQSRLMVAAVAPLLILGALPGHVGRLPGLTDAYESFDGDSLVEIDCDPSPTELEDITFIAEQDGIPLDEAIARYGWQGCFAEMTGHLSEVYSEEYAGAVIVEDGRRAWIAFKGDVPQGVADLVEAIPTTVDLIGTRGFSEAELNETLQLVYSDISNHEDVVAANGSYDIETGVVTIHAQPLEAVTDPGHRERLREKLQPDQTDNAAITIEVIVVDELGGGDDESSREPGGLSSAVYASVLAGGVLVLLAGRLMRDRRHI